MEISEIANFVKKDAPILGAALTPVNPLAGLIISLVGHAFGADSSNTSDIIKKIADDPEAAIKLRSLEYQHAEVLKKLENEKFQTEISDKANSRQLLEEFPENINFMRRLTYTVTIGFFGVFTLIFCSFLSVRPEEKELLSMLVGVLISKWSTIIDFWYGDSRK